MDFFAEDTGWLIRLLGEGPTTNRIGQHLGAGR